MTFARAALLVVISSTAQAQPCPTPGGADGLSVRTDGARLAFLAATLEGEGARAQLWTGAWGGAYAVITAAQLAALPALGPEDQQDFVVGAAASAIGVGFTLFGSLEVMNAGSSYAGRARAPVDVCALIAEGEQLLERDQAAEVLARRWFMHAANVAFNAAVGAIIAFGLKHQVSGLINAVAGLAIGEATIFTTPGRLPDAWSRYRRGELDVPATTTLQLTPFMTRGGAGLGLAGTF